MQRQADSHRIHPIFSLAKCRFPHIDFQILNPQLTFAQNLQVRSPQAQNIISQLGQPSNTLEVNYEISNMKDAVDRQELKIQTSLVNDENVDMSNRRARFGGEMEVEEGEGEGEGEKDMEYGCLELKPAVIRHHEYQSQEIIEQIWMFDSLNGNPSTDWFQH